jgi:hypothetical protein
MQIWNKVGLCVLGNSPDPKNASVCWRTTPAAKSAARHVAPQKVSP